MPYKMLSWNVNGVRAVEKRGFLQWLFEENPDILAIQETKAHPEQLSEELRTPQGYYTFWNHAEKKGYSGVAVFSHEEPLDIRYGFGNQAYDTEGRSLILEYPLFFFLNIYFPNGKMSQERLRFKLDFYGEFLSFIDTLRVKKKSIIVCGDFNTAHQEIDLARPRENSNVSGFLREERDWIDRFIDRGLVDTFRIFHEEPAQYTWWDFKSRARERNVGWRIDYFFIDKESISTVKDAFIMSDVYGSDHCPVGIALDL